MKNYTRSREFRAVSLTRELGGDMVEQLEAFREARRERAMVEAQVESLFAQRGWK